jgi:endonuclease-3 related protein
MTVYETLFDAYGPQGWWPGDGGFETVVGALLTQQTSWASVEKAIAALKEAGLLAPQSLAGSPAGAPRPSPARGR